MLLAAAQGSAMPWTSEQTNAPSLLSAMGPGTWPAAGEGAGPKRV